ncbi:hypothetical protein V6x_50210 [Gimesia chilikensis]|uniref:Uncharacterized protein n=1 Tax=Gimesia chilikensis TaxID=2605989 RepID=A0A517WJ64_9PLAN|nr:hypothetical protein V6x_50210 [Gimesia chilikensis]
MTPKSADLNKKTPAFSLRALVSEIRAEVISVPQLNRII